MYLFCIAYVYHYAKPSNIPHMKDSPYNNIETNPPITPNLQGHDSSLNLIILITKINGL